MMKSTILFACITLLLSVSDAVSQKLRSRSDQTEHRELWLSWLFGGGDKSSGTCQPVSTAQNFDLEVYASKTWYVAQQSETPYLQKDRFNCVTADYTLRSSPTWPWGYTIDVNNRSFDANQKEFGAILGAKQDGSGDPAKLVVSPQWLPGLFSGPYWILAHDEQQGYALVSGGQPDIPTKEGLCQTSTTRTNGSGLWIFSRKPEMDKDLVETVRDIATGMGIDVSFLSDVNQSICGW